MTNLLYKASIVTTPTAYGVGVLNSIKPAYALGENLITNGNFATDSDWTKGSAWTISSGVASFDDTSNSSLSQSISFTTSKSYKISFEITSGSGSIAFLSSNGATTYITYATYTVGVHTVDFKYTTGVGLSIFASTFLGGAFSIDNVSVVEITDADFDFTRASSATRVNPDYLIETVSINSANLVQNGNFSEEGSEQVVNGDFATDSDWSKGTGWTINGGKLLSANSAQYVSVNQNILGVTLGKTYKTTINVSSISGGYIVKFGSSGTIYTLSLGLNTINAVWDGTNNGLAIYNNTSSVGNITIDNVSVKQVDPNDNWTLGGVAEFGNNLVHFESNSNTYSYIRQDISSLSNSKYKIQLEVKNYVSGACQVGFSGSSPILINLNITSNGIYTAIVSSNSNGDDLEISREYTGGNFNFDITDISVIEIQENGVPRLDYTNGTASILLENQSTNLIPYSNNTSSYSKANITATDNFTTSPEGQINAAKLLTTSTGQCNIKTSFTAAAGNYTGSIFLKKQDFDFIYVELGGAYAWFNISTGATGNSGNYGSDWTFLSHSVESFGNNWYRCIITGNCINAGGYNFRSMQPVSSNGSYNSNLNNGTTFWFGCQLEALSYATSYIPTSGQSGGVTRAAETLNNAGNSDLINSTEGVFYAEISALANDGTNRCISLYDGTVNNRLTLLFGSTNNSIRALIKSNNASTFDATHIVNSTLNFHKIGVKYKENDFALWIDGVEVATDSSGATPIGLNALTFDTGNGGQNLYGRCKSVAVFSEALSDTELACLTSTNNREIFLNYYYRMQYVGANTEALSCAEQTFNI